MEVGKEFDSFSECEAALGDRVPTGVILCGFITVKLQLITTGRELMLKAQWSLWTVRSLSIFTTAVGVCTMAMQYIVARDFGQISVVLQWDAQ